MNFEIMKTILNQNLLKNKKVKFERKLQLLIKRKVNLLINKEFYSYFYKNYLIR